MTATTTALMNEQGPPVPAQGSAPMAANTLIPKGTLVTLDASGNANSPGSADTSGNPAWGISKATYNNKTGSEAGGTAGDLTCEVYYGVGGFTYSGTAPLPGDTVFVVDNQTISIDSLNGTRGFAGVVTEVRGTKAFVFVSPLSRGMLGGGEGIIPLEGWRLTTGAAVAAFSAGSADGYSLTSSEGFGLRWNDDVFTSFVTSVLLPADLDGGKPVIFHALGFRVGTADTTAALTVGAFIQSAGDLVTADADLGGASGAFDTAASLTLQEVTRTFAAVDVPEGPSVLTITVVPSAALDDDDLVVLKMWLSYSKR